jgi:energy-coupling factor transporter transmembrane protein EcfT
MSSLSHPSFHAAQAKPLTGSLGHLAIFAWALGMALLPAGGRGIPAALLAMALLGALYPFALRRVLRPRWLLVLAGLFAVNLLFGGMLEHPDMSVLGLPLARLTLYNALHMTLRAVVILLAADGLSASVGITEVAGALERGGLHGLGFSLGVATNLLPDLRRSSTATWHSLRMRGGLRGRWLRGLQLLLLAVMTNALRHAEEIVLAAETRAFLPEKSRSVPLKRGRLDGWIVLAAIASLLAVILL